MNRISRDPGWRGTGWRWKGPSTSPPVTGASSAAFRATRGGDPRTADAPADAARLLGAFLPAAFRRPVDGETAAPFVQFALARLERGYPFAEASVTEFVGSGWSFLDGRLARHYGIPGVDSWELRRTSLPLGARRGGVITHAAILKVTANGTTTSPVLRGKWVLERILGSPPPPPPPDLPALEPDIRGATTIRQQLDKHRHLPACATCRSCWRAAGSVTRVTWPSTATATSRSRTSTCESCTRWESRPTPSGAAREGWVNWPDPGHPPHRILAKARRRQPLHP